MRHPRSRHRLWCALAACAAASVVPAQAQERTEPVVAERPARVQIIAGFDAACQSLAAPTIKVTVPPQKGDVSLREAQETRVAGSLNGTCAGARVKGTGIYYTARPGTTGRDTFSISARLATGETSERTFVVTIAE